MSPERSLAWLLNSMWRGDDLALQLLRRQSGLTHDRLAALFDGAAPTTVELVTLERLGVPMEPCREWRECQGTKKPPGLSTEGL